MAENRRDAADAEIIMRRAERDFAAAWRSMVRLMAHAISLEGWPIDVRHRPAGERRAYRRNEQQMPLNKSS